MGYSVRKQMKHDADDGCANGTPNWWTAPKDAVGEAVWAHLRRVEKQQQPRNRSMMRNLELYNGRKRKPGKATGFLLAKSGELIALNVVANIVRTLRAKITKNRPRPWLMTDGASQELQHQAELKQQFAEGCLYETCAYELGERVFDHAAICNEGYAKIFADFDAERIIVERAYPWEVLTDDQDGYYDDPMCRYQIKHMDRGRALAIYPKHAKTIKSAPISKGFDEFGFDGNLVDQIKICEVWRRAAGKNVSGRHVIAVEGQRDTLLDEPWERGFPLIRLLIEPEPVGCHGTGVVDELAGMQLEINETLLKVQEGNQLGGNVLILVESGSKVDKDKITNKVLGILSYTGTKPSIEIVPAVAPETYTYLWTMVDRMYSIWGISQMSAAAEKPAGLQSGKALRTFHDIESERFSYLVRAYEKFFQNVMQAILDAAADLAAAKPGLAVTWKGSGTLKRVKWSEVATLKDDQYVLEIFPTSFLPQSPEGRMQAVQDMLDLQIIDPREARMFLDFPDLKSRVDHFEESYRLATSQIEGILMEGKTPVIESFQDYPTAFRLGLGRYCKARQQKDVPDTHLELLRTYIQDVEARMKELAAQQQPAQPQGAQ